jgi:hypothetical protein
MWTAITTLAAVFVGGLLSYVAQARLDHRRMDAERTRDAEASQRERERDEEVAQRDREREEAVVAEELRVATRLLLEELDTIGLHHAMLVSERTFPQAQDVEGRRLMFPTDVWEADKRTFARGLSQNQWDALSRFMHTVPRVRAIVLAADPNSAVPPALVESLRNGALFARDAYMMLAGFPAPSVTDHGEPA